MPAILPKRKAPGVDFCGVNDYYYIVRSDLGCYMRSSNFNHGTDLAVYSLHLSCQGGDHYLAHQDGRFYIIKGNEFRRVTNMNKDESSAVFSLHHDCQGGDHYLSAFGKFYIIFQDKGVYRRTTNMNTNADAAEFTLHPNCKDGLYYWGIKDYYYFLKPDTKWGIQYYKGTNFNKNEEVATYSVHSDVVNFLPGGLAVTQGVTFGRWENIKTISNDSASPVTWTKKITKKVGFRKEKMSSIEHNWNVSMTASYSAGDLTAAFAKYQFSVTAEYGGASVNTDTQEWTEATEVEESITMEIKPNEKMYIWQYNLGLGKEAVLFCRDLKLDDISTPPSEIPLPPSKEQSGYEEVRRKTTNQLEKALVLEPDNAEVIKQRFSTI